MRKIACLLVLVLVATVQLGCNERTDKSDGSVILSITGFDGLPFQVSVNSVTTVQVGQFDLQNFPKDANSSTSSLQNIELRTVEIAYSRADSGSVTPTNKVDGIFGLVPVGGTDQIDNLPVMGLEQLQNPPLSDLLFQNGGFDKETGSTVIKLNFIVRFFGRTLAGDTIVSNTATFPVEFVP